MTTPRTPESFRGPETILVPCDFSECSRSALEYAAGLARPFDATLVLLHVIEPVQAGFLLEGAVSRQSQGWRRGRAVQELAAWTKRWAPGVRTGRPLVKAGKPWKTIVDCASKSAASLIVLGTHGRTGLKHAVLGSVAERVVRHAPCPVLTVRPRTITLG